MTDVVEKLDAKELAFVLTPMNWPRWPVLPMKHRRRPSYEPNFIGFILSSNVTKVYLDNYRTLGERAAPRPKTWSEAIKGLSTEEFASVEEMLKHWTVD